MTCQTCGHDYGPRTARYTTTFLGKPLCRSWRACYQRHTGHRAPKPYYPTRRGMLILADGTTSKVRIKA